MKIQIPKTLTLFAIAFLVSAASAVAWFGMTRTQAVTNTVDQAKVINGSVYSAGETVTIAGTVHGDVHCVGQEVMITGTIHGDILCVAQKLTVSGKVSGSIRAAAQELVIKSSVGHSATLAGETVTLTRGASIAQDATVFGETVKIDGSIGRDITVSGSSVDVANTIGRNIVFNGRQLELVKGADVKGSIRYQSENSITIDDNALVNGAVTRTKADDKKQTNFSLIMAAIMVSLYLFALVLVLLWPQKLHAVSTIAVQHLGKVLITGILAAIVAPFAIALMAATIIGIPLAIFLILLGCLVALLSGPVAAYYLGSMLLSRSKNAVAIMAVGATVLLVVYNIPIAGMVALIAAHIIGSGALLLGLFSRTGKPNYRVE